MTQDYVPEYLKNSYMLIRKKQRTTSDRMHTACSGSHPGELLREWDLELCNCSLPRSAFLWYENDFSIQWSFYKVGGHKL